MLVSYHYIYHKKQKKVLRVKIPSVLKSYLQQTYRFVRPWYEKLGLA